MASYHEPVLVDEVLRFLAPERAGTYLDATLGGGGHAEAILTASPQARLLGIDRDPEAIDSATQRLRRHADRIDLAVGNYADCADSFGLVEGTLVGVLVDLGVSSHQIDEFERGFTFRSGAPLDMRMAGGAGGAGSGSPSAAELLNTMTSDELIDLFRRYGEIKSAGRLVGEIVRRRASKPFATSDDLVATLETVIRRPATATRLAPIFQALRIAVNDELGSLERALPTLRNLLNPGGRLVVIAYHSLEDRIVKRALKEWSLSCICPPDFPICRCRGRALGRELTRRPVRPSPPELEDNPRARSARLRAWEKAAAAETETSE